MGLTDVKIAQVNFLIVSFVKVIQAVEYVYMDIFLKNKVLEAAYLNVNLALKLFLHVFNAQTPLLQICNAIYVNMAMYSTF